MLEPFPGLYANVVVLDFKSLYPSLIRTFEIDPLNLVRPETGAEDPDPIVAPNGAAFSRSKAILGALLDELMPRRDEARRDGDEVKSHAIKILMNSFYGVLGTPACRFYDPRLANAITSVGREMLLWCKAWIEFEGRRVLYGDTDSLFVESSAEDPTAARAFGQALAARLNRDLAAHINERWRVASRLDLAFDRLYLRLCLPAMRHDAAGARKRYAGLVETGSGARVVFTGMEAVRTTGPSSRRRSSGSCIRGSSRTSRSRNTCATSSPASEPGNSTTGSSTAGVCGRAPRRTRPRLRPTSRWRG